MPEGVDNTSVWYERLYPLVQCRTCRIRITPRRVCKTWKGEFRVRTFKNTSSSPKACTNKRYHSLTVCSLQLPPRIRFQTDMWDIVIQLYIRFQKASRFGKPHSGVTDKRNQPPQIIVCTATCLLYQTEMRGRYRQTLCDIIAVRDECLRESIIARQAILLDRQIHDRPDRSEGTFYATRRQTLLE